MQVLFDYSGPISHLIKPQRSQPKDKTSKKLDLKNPVSASVGPTPTTPLGSAPAVPQLASLSLSLQKMTKIPTRDSSWD